MSKHWSSEEDAKLKEIYQSNSKDMILSIIKKPWTAIKRRAIRLGLHRDYNVINEDKRVRVNVRVNSWSDDEVAILKEVYEHNTKEFILSKFDRSWDAIKMTAHKLSLVRDRELIVAEMIEGGKTAPKRDDSWSLQEEFLLIEIYENNSQEFIVSKFNGRTWGAIKEKALTLNLSRDASIIEEDRKNHYYENNGFHSPFELESIREKSRKTNLAKRGVEYAIASPEVRDKAKATVQARYGVDNVFQSKEIKEAIKITNMAKYGVERPAQNKEVQDKTTQTNIEKYGVKNTFQLVDKVKDGMLNKYGYDNPQKVPEIKEKTMQTNMERYGVPYTAMSSDVRDKMEQTNIEKFGFKSPLQNEGIKEKIRQTNLAKYGVDNPLKSKEIQEKARRTANERGGITASRQTEEKDNFLIENYGKLNKFELAEKMGESPRWVKRQLQKLADSGKIIRKHKKPDIILTDNDWTDEIKNRIRELKHRYLKDNNYIVSVLKDEFNIDINSSALQFWVGKFGITSRTKVDWMIEYLPKDKMQELIESKMTLVDISNYVKEKFDIYISDDLIAVHVQSLGLLSPRQAYFESFKTAADNISEEWLEDKINSRMGLSSIAEEAGVSKLALKERFLKDGLSTISRRRVWSESLENMSNLLYDLKPIEQDLPIHEMMLGWLLGDGSLDLSGRFLISHSIKQLGYFYLKVRVLKKLISNIVASPRQGANSSVIGAIEQFRLEMYGMQEYIKYLNSDGSKNYEKILSEMTPLGLSCYYMDDGTWHGKKIMCMREDMADKLKNRFFFKEIDNRYPIVDPVDDSYMIPCMSYKSPECLDIGSFWKEYLPEMFNPYISNDLDLSLINRITIDKSIDNVVEYYRSKGFPKYSVTDDYLKKQWDDLLSFDTNNIWKEINTIRYAFVGEIIVDHFMSHINEMKIYQHSPLEVFDDNNLLSDKIRKVVESKLPPIPDILYGSLIEENKNYGGFSCVVAKTVTDRFCLGELVVDPLAGWGGRMLGVTASGRQYAGFESINNTQDKLKSIISVFSLNAEINNDLNYFQQECHMILTSIPEIYSLDRFDSTIKDIFNYASKYLVKDAFIAIEIKEDLISRVPKYENIIKVESVYLNTAARAKKPSKVIYMWKKI